MSSVCNVSSVGLSAVTRDRAARSPMRADSICCLAELSSFCKLWRRAVISDRLRFFSPPIESADLPVAARHQVIGRSLYGIELCGTRHSPDLMPSIITPQLFAMIVRIIICAVTMIITITLACLIESPFFTSSSIMPFVALPLAPLYRSLAAHFTFLLIVALALATILLDINAVRAFVIDCSAGSAHISQPRSKNTRSE